MSCQSVLQAVLVFMGAPYVATGTDYVKREKIMIVWSQNDVQPTDPDNLSSFSFWPKNPTYTSLGEPKQGSLQGVYAKTGHFNIFTYLTSDFKTSTIVQQNEVFYDHQHLKTTISQFEHHWYDNFVQRGKRSEANQFNQVCWHFTPCRPDGGL